MSGEAAAGPHKPRHRHQEFQVFLRHLARGYSDQQLRLIMDNYGTHKHPRVKAWLAANPRIHIHFTPTSGSWLNLVGSGSSNAKPSAAASSPRSAS